MISRHCYLLMPYESFHAPSTFRIYRFRDRHTRVYLGGATRP